MIYLRNWSWGDGEVGKLTKNLEEAAAKVTYSYSVHPMIVRVDILKLKKHEVGILSM